MKKISIIIPCKRVDLMTEMCIRKCLDLDYSDYEILVLSDEIYKNKPKEFSDKKIKFIVTGEIKPSSKRNIGMKSAKGEFFAFIDSDAYPTRDWLKNAIKCFEDDNIGIVGGPNLTPENANIWERISGYTLSNLLVSGMACIRYKTAKRGFVKELPSCNYISRRNASSEYDSSFLTAEDSEFCFNAIKKGYKVMYAPDVVVYHHRRDTLKKHLKQMFVYGRDIAWLTKKDFSFDKIYYSILSLFIIGLLSFIILAGYNPLIRKLLLFFILFYFSIIFLTSIHEDFKVTLLVTITGILTHFSYGLGYLQGISLKRPTNPEVSPH
ncbi:glycosyltransferase [Candidatus Pacearchaeota archaeon]|nr:glycosyltransferase [Candidatus Pacearchaeota archaeon]